MVDSSQRMLESRAELRKFSSIHNQLLASMKRGLISRARCLHVNHEPAGCTDTLSDGDAFDLRSRDRAQQVILKSVENGTEVCFKPARAKKTHCMRCDEIQWMPAFAAPEWPPRVNTARWIGCDLS